MYEYHGWATIRKSASSEEEDEQCAIAVRELQQYFDELAWPSGILDIRAVNGEYHVWMAGLDNHTPAEKYDPIHVFKEIGKLASGSYGLLYIKDSDHTDHFNEFKVYTLIRGEVMEHDDPFLSPFIPKIEDN